MASAGVAQIPTIAYAQSKYDLPAPYVSRALGAVLIPINHASRHRYQIPPKLRGVYVLAVAPHGVAARQGIRPGDVLSTVANRPIAQPLDLDKIVWAALALSTSDFLFGVARGSNVVQINTNITINNFNQNVNITNINTWNSVDSHHEWAQIVDQYDNSISDSISGHDYRQGLPEPGQDFDGTRPDSAGALPEPGQDFNAPRANSNDVPEPGQNFDDAGPSDEDVTDVDSDSYDTDDDASDDDVTDDDSDSYDAEDDASDDDVTDDDSDSYDAEDDASDDDVTDDDSNSLDADSDTSDDNPEICDPEIDPLCQER